jgi:hypothetical protein
LLQLCQDFFFIRTVFMHSASFDISKRQNPLEQPTGSMAELVGSYQYLQNAQNRQVLSWIFVSFMLMM